jgi:phage terminase large subunit GpA-like protein
MTQDYATYQPQFTQVFSRNPQLSNIKPSAWAEKNVVIPKKGRLNYDYNPYCRKIIDLFSPDHPARKIAVMKGSQITFSSGVIIPLLGYTIQENPQNTYYMVGTSDLQKMAVEKLDFMIYTAQLQDYIKYFTPRKKNNKSGDTDDIKYFMNGYIKTGAATNPKSVAQVDLGIILLDDYEAMKGSSKIAGSFLDLIEMRAASNKDTYKLGMISTPLLKQGSNIEPAYLAGDQEKYFLECPCCKEPIIIKWEVKEGDVINGLTDDKGNPLQVANNPGGMIYEFDNLGRVDRKRVFYVCYMCGGTFTDKNKQNMLRAGIWQPTANAISDDYFSFHISSLYAPVGMFGWDYYAGKHAEANPPGQPQNPQKMQVLVNTCFGETWEGETEVISAIGLMKNKRAYDVGTIPEKQSMEDGNGRIVLLTCGMDMNGKMKGINGEEDDVRLDYEIVAHSETGATYSIEHGSIGTFLPLGRNKNIDRKKWSYNHESANSVWPEVEKLLGRNFATDTGRTLPIGITALDVGFCATTGAFPFLDKTNRNVVGVKGEKEERYMPGNKDVKLFRDGLERPKDTYNLQVGYIKDRLSELMRLRWDQGVDQQPPGFMNFPQSSKGLYEWENYFEHFESEHRTTHKNKENEVLFCWKKKNSASQNHMWDCRGYAFVARDILLYRLAKEWKVKNLDWQEFCSVATKMIKDVKK